MHAPAMVQHYALSKHQSPAPMLDLVKLINSHFTCEQLEHHILDDQGGDSLSFLQSILAPGSVTATVSTPEVPRYFDLYGPALVSRFQVFDDFNDTTRHRHYGAPSSTFVGLHAMTLVGYKYTNGSLVFLLQNWWVHKQFVEVDEAYLEKSRALITFVKTPQDCIPSKFEFDYAKFHECELIFDKAEGLSQEMSRQAC